MGRHFEVRAAAMAATAKAKSAIYMRASKEIYAAAKSGEPDPNSNLALRSAIEKYRKQCPKDVIDRAIEKAKGGDAVAYIPGRYEFMGPGGSNIVVDTLTDNVNRALVSVRTIVTRKGGKMASVAYNFNLSGVLDFKGPKEEEVEEALVLGDVDVSSVTIDDDGEIEAVVAPNDLEKAKDVLKELGVTDFDRAETTLLPNEWIEVGEEDKAKLNAMMNELDEAEDVQAVYTNVSNL
ncbi:MAG: YebC/PmpR family DNA-binding transcriptional regulator [Bacillales bacterium]|nr:YebC/PmpR family DNA-binding transcriptional regulator [Mollicutes bacterium]MCI7213319.1 YebC/PmpR family DNA-binding transcriptional regulator [Bacillales bacterium]MDY3904977.1 YebC/PmpR family DNA-binding transcriptional regulator [Candidatus Enteromonas sp.]MCI7057814.1 YebC/PmpR family DNA-binding transcriptional regulator [Mollicutes bacterium]MDD7714385.1 YebC/PmpR family DNA-binding transcriptional regulator [Mollicutes bacterium]